MLPTMAVIDRSLHIDTFWATSNDKSVEIEERPAFEIPNNRADNGGRIVSFMVGLKKNTFTTIYSYDLSLSEGASKQGFHEISINYLFEITSGKPPLAMRRTKCPVFL